MCIADTQSNEVADIIVDDQPAPVEVIDDVPNVHDRMSLFNPPASAFGFSR